MVKVWRNLYYFLFIASKVETSPIDAILLNFAPCFIDITLYSDYLSDVEFAVPIVLSTPNPSQHGDVPSQWASILHSYNIQRRVLFRMRQRCLLVILVEPPLVWSNNIYSATGKYSIKYVERSHSEDPWYPAYKQVENLMVLHLRKYSDDLKTGNSFSEEITLFTMFTMFADNQIDKYRWILNVAKSLHYTNRFVRNITISTESAINLDHMFRDLMRPFYSQQLKCFKILHHQVQRGALAAPATMRTFLKNSAQDIEESEIIVPLLVDFVASGMYAAAYLIDSFTPHDFFDNMPSFLGKNIGWEMIRNAVQIAPFNADTADIQFQQLGLHEYALREIYSDSPMSLAVVSVRASAFTFVTCAGSHTSIDFSLYAKPFQRRVWLSFLVVVFALIIFWQFLISRYRTRDNPLLIVYATLLEQSMNATVRLRSLCSFSHTLCLWLLTCVILANSYKSIVIAYFVLAPPTSGITTFAEVFDQGYKILPKLIRTPDGNYANMHMLNENLDFPKFGSYFGQTLMSYGLQTSSLNAYSENGVIYSELRSRLRIPPDFPNTSLEMELRKCDKTVFVDSDLDMRRNFFKWRRLFAGTRLSWGDSIMRRVDAFGIMIKTRHWEDHYLAPRIQALSSSGIYLYWEHLRNWTHQQGYNKYLATLGPEILSLEKSNFNSILAIYGIAILICGLSVVMEIVTQFISNMKILWRVYYSSLIHTMDFHKFRRRIKNKIDAIRGRQRQKRTRLKTLSICDISKIKRRRNLP